MIVNPDLCHDNLLNNTKPIFTFDENKDLQETKKEIREKLKEISGVNVIKENDCPLTFNVLTDEKKEGYRLIRFTFESERDCDVPCYMLIPNTGKEKYPVAITMQGHSSGFHNSIGIILPEDEDYHPRGAFAIQAVQRGFIAICVENRAMGCRTPKLPKRVRYNTGCEFAGKSSFTIGRSLLGERMWDMSKLIDLISQFDFFNQCDVDKILITGNSGGGTISYYAAVYDDRIKLSVPSCAFCTFDRSIFAVSHCICNYYPSMRKYFEMQDLAVAIAPRNLILVSGVDDVIFPIDGVKQGFEVVKKIYKKSGAEENCKLIVTPKAHWWCVDIVWPAILEETTKLGWWGNK